MAEKSSEYLDPAGFPVDIQRPIVFDEGGLDPHTELTSTFSAQELGFPGEGFYNVPTIYEGQIYDPEKQFSDIQKYVQQQYQQGYKFPTFPTSEEAVKAAQARSEYIGQIRQKELEQAIQQQRERLLLQMLQGAQ